MTEQIENGLDILRREARGARGQDRNWRHHNSIIRRARDHVEACGGNWQEYEPEFNREIAELMRL